MSTVSVKSELVHGSSGLEAEECKHDTVPPELESASLLLQGAPHKSAKLLPWCGESCLLLVEAAKDLRAVTTK